MGSTRVSIAGATGWTGTALVDGVVAAEDLALASGVSRSAAGRDLGEALGREALGVPSFPDVASALDEVGADVVIDYTSHEVVRSNVLACLERGVAVVVGSSGLTGDDFADIEERAVAAGVGVMAAGNFSITAAMAQAAATLVAPLLPQAEVVDYAKATKPDVPSGTARELAERLAAQREPVVATPVSELGGPREARGADVDGVRVHSVRLPSFVVSTEAVFGLPGERLTIRHDAGESPQPYVAGSLAAARAVMDRPGLTRGLDTLLLNRD